MFWDFRWTDNLVIGVAILIETQNTISIVTAPMMADAVNMELPMLTKVEAASSSGKPEVSSDDCIVI